MGFVVVYDYGRVAMVMVVVMDINVGSGEIIGNVDYYDREKDHNNVFVGEVAHEIVDVIQRAEAEEDNEIVVWGD